MSGTMAEKVWRDHIVSKGENGAPDLLYIDLHLVHEVTSPQAFETMWSRHTFSAIVPLIIPPLVSTLWRHGVSRATHLMEAP